MKNINLLSLVQAFNSLEEESYTTFLGYYGIDIKNEEVEDLESLVDILYDQDNNRNIFSQFYVSYKIPQIGKEFDLLRFGEDSLINIELKRTSTKEKIKKQLNRNKCYLSYLRKKVHNICFISDMEQLFYLNDNDEIAEINVSFLGLLLKEQKRCNIDDVDDLFNPSDYLVSPFNSTEKFIDNKYFLTHQQEEIKNKIVQSLKINAKDSFISITGSAGTGKTLLVYDIAKEVRESKGKPLIIHCGYLNEGQRKLIRCGWEIIPIKNYGNHDLSTYNVIFIDEAQRIYPNQLADIVDKIESFSGNCIFSYDKVQTLSGKEKRSKIGRRINDINSIIKYRLSEKIRTNKEIGVFIKLLFNKKRSLDLLGKNNIELNYFKNISDAKEFIELLDDKEWEIIRFTPSQYDNEHHEKYSKFTSETSHGVIGQEFDSVVVMIDKLFSYDKNGELIYKGKVHYDPVKMLFQNITRTRKKLNLVIIDNEELLNRCVSILKS